MTPRRRGPLAVAAGSPSGRTCSSKWRPLRGRSASPPRRDTVPHHGHQRFGLHSHCAAPHGARTGRVGFHHQGFGSGRAQRLCSALAASTAFFVFFVEEPPHFRGFSGRTGVVRLSVRSGH